MGCVDTAIAHLGGLEVGDSHGSRTYHGSATGDGGSMEPAILGIQINLFCGVAGNQSAKTLNTFKLLIKYTVIVLITGRERKRILAETDIPLW